MSGRVRLAAWASISALVLGTCGCATSSPARPDSKPSTPASPSAHSSPSMAMQSTQLSPLDPKKQPVELRTEMEELFGQDVFVSVRVIRSRLRSDPDFTQAAVSAFFRNSNDLTTLIGRVYGSARAAEFRRLWESQQDGLVAYARADSQHDQDAKAAARSQLDPLPGRIAQFLHNLTAGGVATADISSRLRTHLNDLMQFTDAYSAGDYATAYRIERVGYERQFQLGTVIAAGIVGGRAKDLPASFNSPLTQLRSALGELLGEHMQLMVDAMGAALRGGPEFKADAAQVNEDTTALAGAFGVLFGPQSGAKFENVWSSHIEALISYSAAVADKDQQAKAQAIAKYHAFERNLSTFLATSTDGRLKAPALATVLRMHDSELVKQLDAYARGDFTTEYSVIYDGYQHMFMVAQVLSAAIGPTIAARLPKGGAETGGGGMARTR